HDCERHILAEWHRSSADNGNFLEGAWPLRTRDPLTLLDGSNPQNDADAGAATRGACAGDAAEGAAARWRRRGYYDLRRSESAGSLDVPGAVAIARWH